jgi:hypothetical protein
MLHQFKVPILSSLIKPLLIDVELIVHSVPRDGCKPRSKVPLSLVFEVFAIIEEFRAGYFSLVSICPTIFRPAL